MLILKSVSFEVDERDLIAIIGPNGCGKSTTLKCILGLLKPRQGTITFKGKDITGLDPADVVKQGIAYVPQGRMVFQTMTVEENLQMGGFTLPQNQVKERMAAVYTELPLLYERRKQNATFLSGGQQQMLSIGRALMLRPELLLLDEPSCGLAPNTMADIFRKIKAINASGTTIILVEQNAHMAIAIANKVCVLEGGMVAHFGGRGLAKKKIVQDLYLGH
jgi:branched-chain amino acid transport system ATP-binding protein